ncbi:hypothetical protein [Methylogaea oryzae]|uniref:Uncharacterized protein n=1 Tax=Methylogaea oryzae TaxID=1295382 RepID=A0A8D5AHM5_9GAMM|nr:hypothetical protein [Methylogaea oryzae]BBL70436.1 hypothetical protein MoryE10_10420 [Methylogaea oryzae]
MNPPFDRGDRTYYVSDERLHAFGQLTPEQRLRWVEELAAFLRLAQAGRSERPADAVYCPRPPSDADR